MTFISNISNLIFIKQNEQFKIQSILPIDFFWDILQISTGDRRLKDYIFYLRVVVITHIYVVGVLVMRKATFCNYYFKSFLTDICNPCRLQITHYFTSLVSRFNVYGTLQISPSNFLIFNLTFVRLYNETQRFNYLYETVRQTQ